MPTYDIVVRDNKSKICQFFIGISGDYENTITMNFAEIQKEFPNVNMHTINTATDYITDNELYNIGYFNRAAIYLDLGDESNACKDFKKALSLNLQKDPHFEVDEDFEKLNSLCK